MLYDASSAQMAHWSAERGQYLPRRCRTCSLSTVTDVSGIPSADLTDDGINLARATFATVRSIRRRRTLVFISGNKKRRNS